VGEAPAAKAHTTAAGAGGCAGSEVVCAAAAARAGAPGAEHARPAATGERRADGDGAGGGTCRSGYQVRLRRCYAAWNATREPNTPLQL